MDKEVDFWARESTAPWWVNQDKKYKRTGLNDFSEEFIQEKAKGFKNILEVGSGTGRLIGKVGGTCVDINPKLIDGIHKKYKNVKGVVADVTKMPFKDNEFDLVYTYQVLQHVEDIFGALQEIIRVASNEIILIEGWQKGRIQGGIVHKTNSTSYMHYIDRIARCYRVEALQPLRMKSGVESGIMVYYIKKEQNESINRS